MCSLQTSFKVCIETYELDDLVNVWKEELGGIFCFKLRSFVVQNGRLTSFEKGFLNQVKPRTGRENFSLGQQRD